MAYSSVPFLGTMALLTHRSGMPFVTNIGADSTGSPAGSRSLRNP